MKKCSITFCLLFSFVLALPSARLPAIAQDLKKNIKGSLKQDVYTSQLGDFRVRVPVHAALGGAVRDEYGKRGDNEMEQVIFTDDFGAFFRIVSLKTSMPMDAVMRTFQDVRESQTLQTEQGRELRVINVEKEGAEISVTSIQKGQAPQTSRPDLVTANLVFEKNGRIYHLVAGAAVLGKNGPEDLFQHVRKKLDDLQQGFEVVPPNNKSSK